MKRTVAIAAAGLAAAAALTGCRVSVPTDFGPWPVGRGTYDFEPGLWSAPNASTSCTWTLTNGTYTLTSSQTVVQLPDAPGVKFASKGCGVWRYVSPGQWTPGSGLPQ